MTAPPSLTDSTAALAAAIAADGYAVIPSSQVNDVGEPRFVVTGSDADALASALEMEERVGVNAELRNFLDDALAAGDVFVDLAPGLGFAALAAATAPSAPRVLVLHGQPGIREAIRRSAARNGIGHRVDVAEPQPLDARSFDLSAQAFLVVHAGSAAQVAHVVVGVAETIRLDDVGVIAWSRSSSDDGDMRVATAVLEALGFSQFALTDGDESYELVPANAIHGADMTFSLSPAYVARLNGTADAKRRTIGYAAPSSRAELIEMHASALFEAVQDELMPGAASLAQLPRDGELTMAEIEAAWPSADVISFDIFDTLVVRHAAHPTDVFLHFAKHAVFRELALTPEILSRARQDAERTARRLGFAQHASMEVTLTEIHAVLAADLGWPASRVAAMVGAEREIEQSLCRAHPALRSWFVRAQVDGKQVWCISDTYHEATFLRELLEHCGYDLTHVRVLSSADARCSKADGKLFSRVLGETKTTPSSVLHIGDHPSADADVPNRLGLVTVLHPWAAARHTDRPSTAPDDSVALGLAMIGARTHEPPSPFWWRFGYAVAGPMLTGFALWLHKRFLADGIDRAYFLLRDGEIIEEVYRAVIGASPGPVTALLESSRRAFSLPALQADQASLLSQLMVSENPRPVREFLERLGLTADGFAKEFRVSGFASAEDVIVPRDPAAAKRLVALLKQPKVVRALHERSAVERELLLAYLDQQGVLAGGRIALVDIGWNGTIQKSLVAALALEGRTQHLRGYYLGSLPPAHVELGTSTAAGFLFEGGVPAERADPVIGVRQVVEFMFTTMRGSLRSFTRHHGTVIPVHGSFEHDAARSTHLSALREGVRQYTTDFAALRQSVAVHDLSPDAAVRGLVRTLTTPTAEEATCIGDIEHDDGLGTARARRVAAFTTGAWDVDALNRDAAQTYWPAGLAARRGPQALVLRTMRWLAEGSIA